MIIGASFSNIVKSLTDDVIMPVIGKAVWKWGLGEASIPWRLLCPAGWQFHRSIKTSLEQARSATAVIAYGSFITITIHPSLSHSCVFAFLVKASNKRDCGEKPPTKSEELLGETGIAGRRIVRPESG